jgi:hypothetical protein
MVEPVNRCTNRSWKAASLEDLVWQQIEAILDKPSLIIAEIGKQRQDANQLGALEFELQQIARQIRVLKRDQEQLLQWALKGFPEQTVITENRRINEKRANLESQQAQLETQIKASQDATISLPKLEHLVELIRQKLSALDFNTKRQVLDMLGLKVWLDGHNVEITGVLPVTDDVIVNTQS